MEVPNINRSANAQMLYPGAGAMSKKVLRKRRPEKQTFIFVFCLTRILHLGARPELLPTDGKKERFMARNTSENQVCTVLEAKEVGLEVEAATLESFAGKPLLSVFFNLCRTVVSVPDPHPDIQTRFYAMKDSKLVET